MISSDVEKLWRTSVERVVFRADGGIFATHSAQVHPLKDRSGYLWCLWVAVPQMTIGRIICGDTCPTLREAVNAAVAALLARLSADDPATYQS